MEAVIAGVEFAVTSYTIAHMPCSERAVEALKAAGFEEGVHFVVGPGGRRGCIRLRIPAGIWKLVELKRGGVDWAAQALERLKQVRRDVRRHLRLAERFAAVRATGAEVRPGLAIRWARLELVEAPRITAAYGAAGRVSISWRIGSRGVRGRARVGDGDKAAVLAWLVEDARIEGRRGAVDLHARHLLALARFEELGWPLVNWYARALLLRRP